jgi:hypothetical protein
MEPKADKTARLQELLQFHENHLMIRKMDDGALGSAGFDQG